MLYKIKYCYSEQVNPFKNNDKTIWYSRPTNFTFIMKRILFKIPFAKFTVKIHVYLYNGEYTADWTFL